MSTIRVHRPLLIAFAVLACSSREQPPPNGAFSVGTSAILPNSVAISLARPCNREAPSNVTGAWTPSREQVAALDTELWPALDRELGKVKMPDALRPRAEDYFRQFAGIISGGKKVIYVSGFHKSHFDLVSSSGMDTSTWRTQPVYWCDAGVGYFGAEFDPGTGTLSPISFNGFG